MTLDEIAYNIKNIVEGGISGEDSNISIRQVRSMVHYHRAQLLMKYTNNGRFLSKVLFQTVASNQPFFEIPAFLGFANNKAIGEVVMRYNSLVAQLPSEEQLNVPLVNESERQFFEASRFAPGPDKYYATLSYNGFTVPTGATSGTENMIHVYESSGELLVDENWTTYVSLIASNPEKVPGFSNTTSTYPIPEELVSSLVQQVLSTEFNIILRTQDDSVNNSIQEKARIVKPQQSTKPSANARSRRARAR